MKILEIDQRTDEWHQARLGIPTASKFSDILAKTKSGYSATRANYLADLIVERLTGKPTDYYQSNAMQQGSEREPQAKALYQIKTFNPVKEVGFCLHDQINCGASPDGLIGDDGGIEIKCPERRAHLAYLQLPENNYPPQYKAQIQGNLWITDRKWWDFVSFNPDYPEHLQIVIKRVERDDKFISELEIEIKKFNDEININLSKLKIEK